MALKRQLGTLLLALLAGHSVQCQQHKVDQHEAQWRWYQFPALPDEPRQTGPPSFVVDRSGTPWFEGRKRLWYWDGRAWCEATDESDKPLVLDHFNSELVGGPQRGAYAVVARSRNDDARLYALHAGNARHVANVLVELEDIGVHVSRNGRLFNHTKSLIGTRTDTGLWLARLPGLGLQRREMGVLDLSPRGPVVFVRYKDGQTVLWNGRTFRDGIALPDLSEHGGVAPVPWGDDRALLLTSGRRQLQVLTIHGDEMELRRATELEAVLGPGAGGGLWSDQCGNVYLAWWPGKEGGARAERPFLYRIDPDGHVECVYSSGLPSRFYFGPDTANKVVESRDGSLWVGQPDGAGIIQLRSGQVILHDWRTGMTVQNPLRLCATDDGRVWVGDLSGRVFVWAPQPPTGDLDPNLRDSDSVSDDLAAWEMIHFRRQPLRDPNGGVWVFRTDQPVNTLSHFNGRTWRHISLPTTERAMRRHQYAFAAPLLADDQNHALFFAPDPSDVVHEVTEDGVRTWSGVFEAIQARFDAGAQRFTSDHFKGVLRHDDGSIWLAFPNGCYRYTAGDREQFYLSNVDRVLRSEEGEIVVHCRSEVFVFRDGVMEKIKDEHALPRSMILAGPGAKDTTFYVPGLAEADANSYLPLARTPAGDMQVVTWAEAEAIAAGQPHVVDPKRVVPHSRHLRRAIPDGRGHWWLNSSGRMYWYDGQVVIEVDTSEMPIPNRTWFNAALTEAGSFWVVPDVWGNANNDVPLYVSPTMRDPIKP